MNYTTKRLEEFREKFLKQKICKACLLERCDYSTTGCPWYQNTLVLNRDTKEWEDTGKQLKSFIAELIREAVAEERERLRASGLLKEKDMSAFNNDPFHPVIAYHTGRNALAKAIKDHLTSPDELVTDNCKDMANIQKTESCKCNIKFTRYNVQGYFWCIKCKSKWKMGNGKWESLTYLHKTN